MLNTFPAGMMGRTPRVLFSFSDRSNTWPDLAEVVAPSFTRHDHSGLAEGLIAGTLVATDLGWQPVEDLQPGDRIVTFDNGLRPLKAVRVSTLYTAATRAPQGLWPLEVPTGALGNRSAVQLLPGQPVLIESDAAETLYGDPFLMVSAGSLDGYKGIARTAPAAELRIVTLEFADDEVVYANGTLLVHCPAQQGDTVAEAQPGHAPYQHLTDQQARVLVEAMHQHG
ncbi:MAG: Hint domain-containing protein [Pararhodobacter sp.]